MKEKLVKNIELTNGLTLEILDTSRVIAEDTCLVCIIFKIEINIDKILFNNMPEDSDYNNIKAKLGESVIYEVKRERNFINKASKDEVFNEVMNSFLDMNLKYLSHENFAEKYVMKQYVKRF